MSDEDRHNPYPPRRKVLRRQKEPGEPIEIFGKSFQIHELLLLALVLALIVLSLVTSVRFLIRKKESAEEAAILRTKAESEAESADSLTYETNPAVAELRARLNNPRLTPNERIIFTHQANTRLNLLDTLTASGQFEIDGKILQLKMFFRKPNLIRRTVIEPETQRELTDGFNGEVAWNMREAPNGFRKVEIVSDGARFEMIRDSARLGTLLWEYENHPEWITRLEDAIVDSRQHYVFKATPHEGLTVRHYIDAETFLESRRELERKSEDGSVVGLTIEYSDYRSIDGFVYPFRLESSFDGEPYSVTTIEWARLNTGVSSMLFEVPES